jgi:hypothetical protein
VGLASDRASALVKLGKEEYLGVPSMPDLFHFAQDIGKAAGCQIARKKARLQKSQGKEEELAKAGASQQAYRRHIEQINKTVHPFDSSDGLRPEGQVEKGLLQCFTKIASIATGLGLEIAGSRTTKILGQITDIAAAVQAWQGRIQKGLREWAEAEAVPALHRQWVEKCALPYAYWQLHLNKVQGKARDKELRAYYRQRAAAAQNRYEQHSLTAQLDEKARQRYLEKAFGMAATFQRSSSQVEGRNGYLAFVHNFDIRRGDGTTPAQRLFSKEFPDLFEFLCQNVTGFAEPRKRKRNPPVSKAVQP